jgi:uncharacterized protein YkuJ
MNRPASVVVFAVSILALTSLHAQTLAPHSLPSFSLTPELLGRLLDLVARKGTDYETPALVSNALGLSATGHTWRNRQVNTPDSQPGCSHCFAIDRGGEKDLTIVLSTPNDLKIYRTERNGKIVLAVIYDRKTEQITLRDPAEAQAEVNAEFAFWATAFTKADAEQSLPVGSPH